MIFLFIIKDIFYDGLKNYFPFNHTKEDFINDGLYVIDQHQAVDFGPGRFGDPD